MAGERRLPRRRCVAWKSAIRLRRVWLGEAVTSLLNASAFWKKCWTRIGRKKFSVSNPRVARKRLTRPSFPAPSEAPCAGLPSFIERNRTWISLLLCRPLINSCTAPIRSFAPKPNALAPLSLRTENETKGEPNHGGDQERHHCQLAPGVQHGGRDSHQLSGQQSAIGGRPSRIYQTGPGDRHPGRAGTRPTTGQPNQTARRR